MTVWYAIVRPDNGFPVLIYPEKERAELVASKNGYKVVPVVPATKESVGERCVQRLGRFVEQIGATP